MRTLPLPKRGKGELFSDENIAELIDRLMAEGCIRYKETARNRTYWVAYYDSTYRVPALLARRFIAKGWIEWREQETPKCYRLTTLGRAEYFLVHARLAVAAKLKALG